MGEQSSKMKLAAAIRALPGYALPLVENPLHVMAARAEAGYYHDYESPLATPCIQLATDLRAVGATELLKRHMNGEFDATLEESDAWAAGPDGQAAFAMLIGDRK